MKIKRVFFALVALMLLPMTAVAQPNFDLSPIPQPGTALLVASVFFDNNNTGDSVELKLHCTSGTWSPVSVVVEPSFGSYEQAFVVSQLPGNTDVVCTLTQTPVAGYDTEYDCLWGAYRYPFEWTSFDPDESCVDYKYIGNPGTAQNPFIPDGPSSAACVWTDVYLQEGILQVEEVPKSKPDKYARGGCTIFNNLTAVKVEVTKKWNITTDGGAYYDRDAEVDVYCDVEIKNYDRRKKGTWKKSFDLSDPSSYLDKDGIDVDMATVTAYAYPEWFPTAAKPKEQLYSQCWASEDNVDSSVDVTSDCGDRDRPGLDIGVGKGDSCTIINTLFFEGIPTLNQYGMAIMALLMLGVGFVGFRRFV